MNFIFNLIFFTYFLFQNCIAQSPSPTTTNAPCLEAGFLIKKDFGFFLWSYVNFNEFKQLSFECDVHNDKENFFYKVRNIYFTPSKYIILNETVNLAAFAKYQDKIIQFQFNNLKGFNLLEILYFDYTPATLYSIRRYFIFSKINFDFYLNGHLVDENLCDADTFENIQTIFFSTFS